ncbi:hypothetical protein DYY67_0625 [Candidatus Nitrosotalea sp. TS]|uniref:hypothetical protein n=1 Tax=Candidatus Nitrosotalea sp. TS TaxID=2341020 RepID=UPI001EBE4EAC|nr:hypothetical protein [Candidatus Nitrosotalea sp. TS]NHI02586.1 hypothetical protein [Candidatus Nitrosotalea sp. TS]
MKRNFFQNPILVGIDTPESLKALQSLPFFAGKEFVEAKTQVYVCKDFTCSLPLGTIDEVEKLL